MNKILIIAPSWVGDMVMAEPLLRLLHQRYCNSGNSCAVPDASQLSLQTLQPSSSPPLPPQIDIVAPDYLSSLLTRIPYITKVWAVAFPHGRLRLKERWQLAQKLRAQNYTQAIVLPNSFKSALLPFLAKIPLRTGWRGEMRDILLNDVRILDKEILPLMVQRFVALGLDRRKLPASLSTMFQSSAESLVENPAVKIANSMVITSPAYLSPSPSLSPLFVPQLVTNSANVEQTLQTLRLSTALDVRSCADSTGGCDNAASISKAMVDRAFLRTTTPVLALCIGAEYGVAKRWSPDYFAEVAKYMTQKGWQIWLLGSSKDVMLAAEAQRISGGVCVDLAGKTTLAQAVDLLSCVHAVVTNDSGLMHIAAALDTPLIALYGASSPRFTPPLSNNARVLSLCLSCSPCFARQCPLGHFRCMLNLPPFVVLQALQQLVEV